MKTRTFAIAASVVLAMLPATVAHAAKFWKNGVVTGNWSTGNNWSAVSAAGADNAGVPVALDNVHIVHTDGVARSVTYDVAAPSLNFVIIDLTGAGAAANTLLMPNNLNLTTNAISIGGYDGSAFTTGRGAVTQSGGTLTTQAGSDFIIAWGAGSTGTYTLNGGNVTANQTQWVGFNGTGTFNHSAGTNTINASSLGTLTIGANAGSSGTYNLSGAGSLVSNENEIIGSSGTGMFIQTGGTNTISAGNELFLGLNAGSSGTYTISGGTLTVVNNMGVGSSGTGTLNISGSASVSIGALLAINSTSNVNLNGGTLRFNFIGGTGGVSRINYAAGTIRLTNNFTNNRDLLVDPAVTGLYGGATPTVPAGKTLITEGAATIASATGGTFRVTGGTLTSLSGLDVGHEFGTNQEFDGHIEITGGGVVNSTQGEVGFDIFTNGTALVSGAGSAWNTSGNFWVGGQGDSGLLTVRDGGLVNVATAFNIGPEGIVNLDGGTIRFNDYFRFETGQPFDGQFNFYSGTLQLGGNRDIGSDAVIADILGPGPTLTSGKGLTIEGNATLTTILTLDGGTLTAAQLAHGSNLRLQRGTLNVTNQAVTVGAGGLLGSTLDLNDDMTVNITLGMTNQGLVTGDGQIGGTFANAAAGELRAQAGRSLRLTGTGNTNAGQIKLFGGELEFTQNLTNNASGFISGNGSLIVGGGLVNQGTMNFAGTANIDGAVTNAASGKIISGGGGATIFYDDVVNNGEIRTSTNGFTVFFGSVSGSGTFTGAGTVNFEGDLSPGSSPAQVSFSGDVAFGEAAALQIELGGTIAGSQHDKINVTGDLALDGDLIVTLINGFAPSAGQTFNIMDWLGTRTGAFDSLSLPALSGLSWDTSQLYSAGVLAVAAPGVDGDYNDDGVVDAADYVMWRKLNGTSTAMPNDPNPLPIDNDQYVTWRGNFGANGGGGSVVVGTDLARSTIPEPDTLALLLLAAVIVVFGELRWRYIPCVRRPLPSTCCVCN